MSLNQGVPLGEPEMTWLMSTIVGMMDHLMEAKEEVVKPENLVEERKKIWEVSN